MTRQEVEDVIRVQLSAILRLSIEDVSGDVQFFELGMDSLQAIELVAAVGQLCEVELSAKDLFVEPSVVALANAVLRARRLS